MSLLVQKPEIPSCAWQRSIGKDWENRTLVRYDDGPDHGMPLGGFGAGCIGRSGVIVNQFISVVRQSINFDEHHQSE
ncbi:hypothetical protein IQ218_00620 [Synechocystis salina LEGE 06099]|uniref:hypothetical protein n=1 Tax=Synechocystis salina TaxID=945780 RepID=UPI0018819852|nr:hypothetical protein [Synechocystis salina]MBE9202250.1 hypothetical protein [Synechocystis salina LEGE 06099]